MELALRAANSILTIVIASVIASPSFAQGMMKMKPMKPMEGMMAAADAPVVPLVTGYSEGKRIVFLHTEVSDLKIAKILTDMMQSPDLVVSSLAEAPKEMLARAYVFTNGIRGVARPN